MNPRCHLQRLIKKQSTNSNRLSSKCSYPSTSNKLKHVPKIRCEVPKETELPNADVFSNNPTLPICSSRFFWSHQATLNGCLTKQSTNGKTHEFPAIFRQILPISPLHTINRRNKSLLRNLVRWKRQQPPDTAAAHSNLLLSLPIFLRPISLFFYLSLASNSQQTPHYPNT